MSKLRLYQMRNLHYYSTTTTPILTVVSLPVTVKMTEDGRKCLEISTDHNKLMFVKTESALNLLSGAGSCDDL